MTIVAPMAPMHVEGGPKLVNFQYAAIIYRNNTRVIKLQEYTENSNKIFLLQVYVIMELQRVAIVNGGGHHMS